MTPSLGTGTDIAEKLSHSAQAKKGLLSKGSNGTHLFPALGGITAGNLICGQRTCTGTRFRSSNLKIESCN
jgi:hypothetical protein